jgi:hypothetical protein
MSNTYQNQLVSAISVIKKGFIPKLIAFENLIMWAFPMGRIFRFNLFCGKKDHKKGCPLQLLTQNAVII